jgi:hypothetical protein
VRRFKHLRSSCHLAHLNRTVSYSRIHLNSRQKLRVKKTHFMSCSDSELASETINPFRYFGTLLGWGIGPSQGLYLYRGAQHRKTRTYIHASSGTRTRDLMPHDHWDRPHSYLISKFGRFLRRRTQMHPT